MNIKQFTQDAIRTEARIPAAITDAATFVSALEIAIAAGNLLDMLKKNIYYNKPISRDAVDRELNTIAVAAEMFEFEADPKYMEPLSIDPRILHGVIGKFTEATEMLEAVHTSLIQDQPIDIVNLREEMGDDKWYDAILFDATNTDMEQVCDTVIAKLKARYPDKFDSHQAINRDLATERQILEAGSNKQ